MVESNFNIMIYYFGTNWSMLMDRNSYGYLDLV